MLPGGAYPPHCSHELRSSHLWGKAPRAATSSEGSTNWGATEGVRVTTDTLYGPRQTCGRELVTWRRLDCPASLTIRISAPQSPHTASIICSAWGEHECLSSPEAAYMPIAGVPGTGSHRTCTPQCRHGLSVPARTRSRRGSCLAGAGVCVLEELIVGEGGSARGFLSPCCGPQK
jgi:hypothetical protein